MFLDSCDKDVEPRNEFCSRRKELARCKWATKLSGEEDAIESTLCTLEDSSSEKLRRRRAAMSGMLDDLFKLVCILPLPE